MRALVTGSAGFVGAHLCRHLREQGDDVTGSDRADGGPDMTDRRAVGELLARSSCDIVYHLAGQSHVPTSWRDPIGTLRSNAEGTQNIVDAAFGSGVGRVVAVTSAEIYGWVDEDELPIDENHRLEARNPYAASKIAADAICQQAALGRDQDVVRVRAFNHLGPGQRDDFVAAGLARRIARAVRDGESTIPVGNLSPRRDFTDVRDVVAAYRAVATAARAGEAYNVCSGRDRSVRELAEGLLEVSGAELTLEADPELVRQAEVPVVRGDNTKIRTDTGWRPTLDLATSLRDIYQDAVERLDG